MPYPNLPLSIMPQVPITISKAELKALEKLREETGLPVARLLDLERRGYMVVHKPAKSG